MSDLLLVLNPRRITECVNAIRELPIDKLWIRNMTEQTIQDRWGEIIDMTSGYDRLYIVSDDCLPRPHALRCVRLLLDCGLPVATGYCNLGADDLRVNLCDHIDQTRTGKLPLLGEIMAGNRIVSTAFAGFALTAMSRDMWAEYPYRVDGGGFSADRVLCERLAADKVPIVAHRDAFMWHVKERWSRSDQEPRKRLLVGVEPAELRFEVRP